MRHLRLAAGLAVGTLLTHLPLAHAGAGDVITMVTPLQSNVTYSAAALGGAFVALGAKLALTQR